LYIDQDGKTSFEPATNVCSAHQSSYLNGYVEGLKASLRTRGTDELSILFIISFY
jgi:hypothetical protein